MLIVLTDCIGGAWQYYRNRNASGLHGVNCVDPSVQKHLAKIDTIGLSTVSVNNSCFFTTSITYSQNINRLSVDPSPSYFFLTNFINIYIYVHYDE
jgi:hypothetical protein